MVRPSPMEMELNEGKAKFIESWGKLGTYWGINRTMAQIHALLLISPTPVCAETVMQNLHISRGNANMNLRALLDWGLVHKVLKPGQRKEFFEAEKDMWKIFKQVIHHRRKKEFDPMMQVLEDISTVKPDCPESEEFCHVVKDLKDFSNKAGATLQYLEKADNNFFVNGILKAIR